MNTRVESLSSVGRARSRRPAPVHLQHVALRVADLCTSEHFYREILGFEVVWRPNEDEVYLTSGADNLALHRSPKTHSETRLDHIGFAVESDAAVDAWHEYLSQCGVPIEAPPRTHRDGARSFYCTDPNGTTVQILYEPRLSNEHGSALEARTLDAGLDSREGEE